MPSIADYIENIQAKLDQAVVNRRNKVMDDMQAKLKEQIEKNYETPDVQPTCFCAAVPLHDKDRSHFMKLCVDGVVAHDLGYGQDRIPPLTWKCKTEVKERYDDKDLNLHQTLRALFPETPQRQPDAINSWMLTVTIEKIIKKKMRRTTPQHELPQYPAH